MKLYVHGLSGHSHRARLFASLAGIPVETVNVDLATGEHKKPAFLAINPFGQVPVLDDDGVIVADSNAILVYLAKKFARTGWLPEDARGAAEVQRWLSVAARLITVFGAAFNAGEVIKRAHAILALIDAELTGRDWIIAGDKPTVADVALYSYIARAPEGNVDLSGYPAVNAWLKRIEALPGYVEFVRTPVGLAA
nr:glutathione S-transferase family protein [uncultured Rhodopila sp.]